MCAKGETPQSEIFFRAIIRRVLVLDGYVVEERIFSSRCGCGGGGGNIVLLFQ